MARFRHKSRRKSGGRKSRRITKLKKQSVNVPPVSPVSSVVVAKGSIVLTQEQLQTELGREWSRGYETGYAAGRDKEMANHFFTLSQEEVNALYKWISHEFIPYDNEVVHNMIKDLRRKAVTNV